MRNRPLPSSVAVSLTLVALLAGCSQLQGSRDLPPSGSMQSNATRAQNTAALLKEPKSPFDLLELQLAGKLPAPVPPQTLRYSLQQWKLDRPKLAFHAGAKVGLWASDTNFNYLLGQDATGLNTVTAIDASAESAALRR